MWKGNKEKCRGKKIMVTFGDMAEALYQLRQKYGLYYNPSEQEIFRYTKNMQKPKVNRILRGEVAIGCEIRNGKGNQ